MITFETQAVVVGAGVIGLATAAAFANNGIQPTVLEQEALMGSITSARNSEVIHAGIYYHQGSLKAHHCLEGRKLLYSYLAKNNVGHAKLGKYIVAESCDDESKLIGIRDLGLKNEAGDLRMISSAQLKAEEPELVGAAALFSPETGIVDSHGLMLVLRGEIEAGNGAIAFGQSVISVRHSGRAFEVIVKDRSGEVVCLKTPRLVNAAGHGAVTLAQKTEGLDFNSIPERRFAKGTYMKLSGSNPFRHLIYPLPVAGALGIHATLDLNGGVRFGPDIEWTKSYDIDPSTIDPVKFYEAIRHYWPALREGALSPDYSGVRPKVVRDGKIADDFIIDYPEDHGLDGLAVLYGIESPGLTSALSIGAEVAKRLQ